MPVPAFKLEEAGFSREQVEALSEFMDGSVASKADIERLDGNVKADIKRLEGRLNLHTWMLGLVFAAIVAPWMKALFG